MRLVIADDHPLVLSGLNALLATSDHEVVASERAGDAALAAALAHRPDALVLDVNMPGLTGLDVLRDLRGRGSQLPVVLLTGTLGDADAVEAIQLSVDGIVLKDSAADLLLRCLDEVNEGRKWIDREVMAQALGAMTRPNPMDRLTPRELEIARYVAIGRRNREIGDMLRVSESTIKGHLANIFDKLGIENRTALVALIKDHDREVLARA